MCPKCMMTDIRLAKPKRTQINKAISEDRMNKNVVDWYQEVEISIVLISIK